MNEEDNKDIPYTNIIDEYSMVLDNYDNEIISNKELLKTLIKTIEQLTEMVKIQGREISYVKKVLEDDIKRTSDAMIRIDEIKNEIHEKNIREINLAIRKYYLCGGLNKFFPNNSGHNL